MRKTKELLLTSKLIDGNEAERIGLVNQAVAPDELDDAAWTLARDVARSAPVGLRMSKLATNLDTFFHQSPSYVEFFRAVREGGMQEALRQRAEKYG